MYVPKVDTYHCFSDGFISIGADGLDYEASPIYNVQVKSKPKVELLHLDTQ